ncbi:MAG: DNA polymerase Y family protein, partial [Thermodesulfobacteriota bacterium]
CIAASYEAKKYGIKTGTNVAEARKICKELKIVESRPEIYIEMHHKIWSAVNSVLPVDKVLSIDEMACRLTGRHAVREAAVEIGYAVKKAIRAEAGEYLRCSVGIAPNRFLAKVASDMQKPDGLTVISREELPQKLYTLSLTDLPGIGRSMHARLKSRGVHTVESLCTLSEERVFGIWGSVVGKGFLQVLRGEDIIESASTRKSVGHSHVLPPEWRTDEGVRAVFVKLIHKAAFRLRSLGYLSDKMAVAIDYLGDEESWAKSVNIGKRNDTQTMIGAFSRMWEERPSGARPLRASVTFIDLVPSGESAMPLFDSERKLDRVAGALDEINERYGMNSIYFGGMYGASESAPMRIGFTSIPDVVAEGNKVKRKTGGPGRD